jgi:hypothetical protein
VVEEEEAVEPGSKKRSSVQNPPWLRAPMRPCARAGGCVWMDEQTWRLALGGARGDSRGGLANAIVYVRAG